eukprot:Trichotokara_eunicae@DN4684_c0_g1_i1.p2
MSQRLNYRRQCHYKVRSNKQRTIRTPGDKLVYFRLRKKDGFKTCGDCHQILHGVSVKRGERQRRQAKHKRTVSRAYGGVLCHKCVRARVSRAFLYEEQRAVAAINAEKVKAEKHKQVEAEKRAARRGNLGAKLAP